MQPSEASKSKLKCDDETESDLLSGVDLLDFEGEIDDRLLDSTEQLKIDDSSSGASRSYSALAGEGSNDGYDEEAYDGGVPYTGFDDDYSDEMQQQQQQQEVSQNEVFANPTLPQKEVTGTTELPSFASFSQMRHYPQCFTATKVSSVPWHAATKVSTSAGGSWHDFAATKVSTSAGSSSHDFAATKV